MPVVSTIELWFSQNETFYLSIYLSWSTSWKRITPDIQGCFWYFLSVISFLFQNMKALMFRFFLSLLWCLFWAPCNEAGWNNEERYGLFRDRKLMSTGIGDWRRKRKERRCLCFYLSHLICFNFFHVIFTWTDIRDGLLELERKQLSE